MLINIADPFSSLSGFAALPLEIDRKWLRAEMKKTGLSAKECIVAELAKIPAMIHRNILHASDINKQYVELYGGSE
jgi:hypothetical protein